MRGDRFRRPFTRRSGTAALDQLHDIAINFEPAQDPITAADGWRIDDYCIELPPEPPGPPSPDGSWAIARRLLQEYEFADPDIVRAVYYPDHPLDGRTMLLEGRFLWMRFHFGVRIGGVIDSTEELDGRRARRWGWNYRTLQGHLEMGQMDYEVRKWLDNGSVEFRIHAFSRAARIPNPVVRVGFQLFGRHVQRRFTRSALDRMQQLVEAELAAKAGRPLTETPVRAADHLRVEPARIDPGVAERMDRTGETH